MFEDVDEYIFCDTFQDVFEAIDKDEAKYGIVATHNSAYGDIPEVVGLRKKYNHFKIFKEVTLRVELHLLGIEGATLSDIKEVYSQAPALVASEAFLDKLDVTVHEYHDTAAAAKFIASSGDKTKAAVASESAANDYELEIIKRNTETAKNYTNFILFQRLASE